jgi:Cu/Ag efflux pump CusA
VVVTAPVLLIALVPVAVTNTSVTELTCAVVSFHPTITTFCQRDRIPDSVSDLLAAVREGAVQRIRPKMMAVCSIFFGLLPIMWSPDYEAGQIS